MSCQEALQLPVPVAAGVAVPVVAIGRGRGFTLIELLLVLGLGTVMLLGTMTLQVVASKSNSASRYLTEASELAQDGMEKKMRLSLFALLSAGTATTTEPNLNARGTLIPPGIYTRTSTVTVTGLSSATIEVDVSYADGMTSNLHTLKTTATRWQ